MTEKKTSEAQLRANREYRKRINEDEDKKKHRNYMTSKRTAKSFINSKAIWIYPIYMEEVKKDVIFSF